MRSVMVVCLTALVAIASSSALEVPISVEEPVGAARQGEVVCGGIPLPEGKYKDTTAFSLFEGSTEIPLQVSPIVKYPDGSLHWALVSFPVTIEGNSKKTYVLKNVKGRAKPDAPVTVKEDGDLVKVSNGIVSFAVNRADFNGFEYVRYRDKEIFKMPEAALVANGQGGPGKLTHLSFPYRGPVRTTMYLKGTYGNQQTPTWAMTVTLNAGESTIHINHNLRNGGLGVSRVSVLNPKLCLGLACELSASGGSIALTEERGRKLQPAYGWRAFSGDEDLLVFIRHGGPIGGKGLTLTYEAVTEKGELVVDMSTVKDNDYVLREGAHKVTEIDLVFGKSESPEALAEPLHALAPSAWYSEHDGMGVGRGFGSLEDETRTYKNCNLKGAGDPKKMPNERPNPNLYKSWFDAHATSECDQLRGLTVGYVRTGQRGFLDRATAWARYWRTFFLYRSDEFIYGKDGRYQTSKWGSGRCCTEGCHFYAVGLFNYALLTGDIDSLEAAFDAAEFANLSWYGMYSNKKPGDDFSAYGSRGFARCYVVVARAYDVARTKEWQEALLHYVNMATKTPARDPRGFTIGWSGSSASAAQSKFKNSPAALQLFEKEGVEIVGKNCKHPKYGEYQPKCVGTWPEAIESWANLLAWESLSSSRDPAAQLAAEDAKDYAIAEAYLGAKYAFDPIQKAIYYYMYLDFPIPDYVPNWKGGKWDEYQPKGTDSWYTKWWPNTFALGYKLTGDPMLKEKMNEVLWWGLSRDYVNPPRVPRDEAPPYASISTNTKGDCVSPTALAFGVGAHLRKDAEPAEAITDLAARALGGGKVELTWTSPADRGGGRVARYQVKWSHKLIKDYLDVDYREEWRNVTYWNMAKNVLGEPAPQPPGKKERMVVQAEPGTCYFAVRSEDGEPNRSKLSNVVEIAAR